jgi:hypothetical protein
MKEVIYLVGQISPIFPETYKWREEVKKYFEDRPKFSIIDPCGNAWNQNLLNNKSYPVNGFLKMCGVDIIVPKDRSFVSRSTIAIANMNQYDQDKPLIGSFFELAWYYDHPDKTVIGYADDMGHYFCQHPFVKASITTWVKNHLQACELIIKFFEGD